MWALVPTVSLLIGVILASCEIDVILTDVTQPEVENTDASSDDRNRLSTDDSSNTWKEKEPLVMGEIYEERIDPNHQTDATDDHVTNEYLKDTGHPEYDRRIDLDSFSKDISRRRENIGTWLDLDEKSKELRNPPHSSQRRRKKKKKKNTTTSTMTPWNYRWGNKRKEGADRASSNARLIRAPFNNWGGKRESAAITFPALQENMYDRYGRDLSIDGNDVKKKAEDFQKMGWKLPFNSWGGKRTGKSNDRQRYLTYLKERIYDAPILHVYKVHGSTKERNNENNDDEENDNILYRMPYHLHNETSEDDSSTSNDVDGRVIPILEKRTKHHEICKKSEFNPWGGKRSFKSDSIHFDKTVAFLAYSKTGKTVFCCYPIDETRYETK